ncbi:unnamed protein product, partial [Rotaria magnacalcarata]
MTSSDNTQELKISENLGVLTANVLETEFLTDENDSNEAAEPSLEASREDINCENRQILEAAFVSERSIDESSTSPQSSPIEALALKRKRHIMISYNHEASYDICRRICDELRRRGFEVWIDEDNLDETIFLQALANAVENSYFVLLCFNSAYAASEYCRKEACYAIEKRIPYIPSRMEAAFDPTGWLGITIADHVYCDFSSPNDFNKALEKLMRQIKNFETQLQSDS